jgi:hypothetical protein
MTDIYELATAAFLAFILIASPLAAYQHYNNMANFSSEWTQEHERE